MLSNLQIYHYVQSQQTQHVDPISKLAHHLRLQPSIESPSGKNPVFAIYIGRYETLSQYWFDVGHRMRCWSSTKWNESGFRPLLCTYRLNWAVRTSWGWWDDWDDTVLQTQDSKFEPWRSEAEHATSRSRRLPTILTRSSTNPTPANTKHFYNICTTSSQRLLGPTQRQLSVYSVYSVSWCHYSSK